MLHTEAEAEAQEEADTLKLLLCVPVTHCVPDALTDKLAEDDCDSDGVEVTQVDTDTVEDGVCDCEVVRDVVKLDVTEALGVEETDSDSVPLLHIVGLPVGEALPETL